MAYALWQKTLTDLVEIPSLEKYKFIRRGIYGARCYPMQKKYKSQHYDKIINKTMLYDDLKKSGDYIFNADATSLYPASMAGFDLCDVQYPVGKSRWIDKDLEIEYKNKKYGFYEIDFICPKNIIIPILPRKTAMGGLEWSLFDGTGVYTNVDIDNAIENGYTITFKNNALIWDETAKVFTKYVETYYKMKNDAEKENNEVKRSIAKLLLNAMYGKTLQRAIFEQTSIINNYNDLLDFYKDFNVTNFDFLGDGNDENTKLLMTGESKKKETKITKPCQLGAFVLAFSRTIMLNYMKAIDPTLTKHIFTYTDTDSLHIMGEYAQKLFDLGYVKDKKTAELGYLCSDIKNEGIIINEINLAPKSYKYEYINNKNEVKDNNNAVFKCKGIPKHDKSKPIYDDKGNLTFDKDGEINYKKLLTAELYDMENKNVDRKCTFSGLRKKHINLTKHDKEINLNHFSIVNNVQTREFMKNEWTGMIFKDNLYYPKGYEF
jgi:hypothetical protein